MIEIERRYKIYDAQAAIDMLDSQGLKLEAEQHIIDRWYIPRRIGSQHEHDEWFDENHGVAYRIRKSSSLDGTASVVLDSKQHTEANDHNTFAEEVIMQDDEDAMQRFIDEKGYFNWLTIDKKRRYFLSDQPELKVTMDTVVGVRDMLGLDTVLEIEYEGESTRDEALAIIDDFSSRLGLAPSALFEKSLTTETMAVLAKFE